MSDVRRTVLQTMFHDEQSLHLSSSSSIDARHTASEDEQQLPQQQIDTHPPPQSSPVVITISSNHASQTSAPSPSPVIKRRRTNPPPSKSSPKHEEEDEDSNMCTICLSAWTNAGPHQLCCMPCGHLFGYSCIKQWLQPDGRGSRRKRPCPTCKQPARVKELRQLYGLPINLRVADASETQRLREQLKTERETHKITRAKLSEVQHMADLYRRKARDLEKQLNKLNPSTRTFGDTGDQPTGYQLNLLASRKTNGACLAVACDPTGSIVYTESAGGGRTRIVRANLGRISAATYAPGTSERRVNALSLCMEQQSVHFRFIAAASADRTVRVLSPSLQTIIELPTPGVPISVSWLSQHPYLVTCGMHSGDVFTYDVRNSISPVYRSKMEGTGFRAVHSITELGKMTLGASPGGIFAIEFGASNTNLRMLKDEVNGSICGISTWDNLLAVLSRNGEGRQGCVEVFEGIKEDEDSLKLGTRIGTKMTGFVQDAAFAQTSIVKGGDDGRDSLVVYADSGMDARIRAWGFGRDDQAVLNWKDVEVNTRAQDVIGNVKHVSGLCVPKSMNMNGVNKQTKAVFACASDDVVNVYAARPER